MSKILVARCENVHEPEGAPCPGRLSYRWGQSDAACDTCGARCGIAVADWLTVEAATARRLAWFTDEELSAELDRRRSLDGTDG